MEILSYVGDFTEYFFYCVFLVVRGKTSPKIDDVEKEAYNVFHLVRKLVFLPVQEQKC